MVKNAITLSLKRSTRMGIAFFSTGFFSVFDWPVRQTCATDLCDRPVRQTCATDLCDRPVDLLKQGGRSNFFRLCDRSVRLVSATGQCDRSVRQVSAAKVSATGQCDRSVRLVSATVSATGCCAVSVGHLWAALC